MFNIAVMVLRYIFLALLLWFIFRLVKWMVGDLQQTMLGPSARYKENILPAGAARPAGGGALLTIIESSSPDFKPGDSLALGREKQLGRGEGSDILIRDSFASSRHALIFFKEGQYWLEDLGSTNGTFLNDVKIDHTAALADRDIIKIGGIIFQFMR